MLSFLLLFSSKNYSKQLQNTVFGINAHISIVFMIVHRLSNWDRVREDNSTNYMLFGHYTEHQRSDPPLSHTPYYYLKAYTNLIILSLTLN